MPDVNNIMVSISRFARSFVAVALVIAFFALLAVSDVWAACDKANVEKECADLNSTNIAFKTATNNAMDAQKACDRATKKNSANASSLCSDAATANADLEKAKAESKAAKKKCSIATDSCGKGVDASVYSGGITSNSKSFSCPLTPSTFYTHYGVSFGLGGGKPNACIPCMPCYWGCCCTKFTWCGDFWNCLRGDVVNPSLICAIKHTTAGSSRYSNDTINPNPAFSVDTYYRDMCIKGATLDADKFDTKTGLPTSTDDSEKYGEKYVGLATGAKPMRSTCAPAVNTPKFSPPTDGEGAFAAYKNANNVDFKTSGKDAAGASGEYKNAYVGSQNVFKSAASFLGGALGCPSDLGGNPTTAAQWKEKAGLCYDYYILRRAVHPEWTLEVAGKTTNDPLTKSNPEQAIFNSCQPLMNGEVAKKIIGGAQPITGEGFAPVLQYTGRPDLDEADYKPSKYLTNSWNEKFPDKIQTAPAFQDIFPCVKSSDSGAVTKNWVAFNVAVDALYGLIYAIEKQVLQYDKKIVYFSPVDDLTGQHGYIRSDLSYKSAGGKKDGFCPNIEKINNPSHPFSPRDDLYKKPLFKEGLPLSIQLEAPDLTFQHKYGTDRGYSWETSSPIAIKERLQNGIEVGGYSGFANPANLTSTDKLKDMVMHPEVQCAVVPVDILEPRRAQFDNCIMQRIEYNYFSWRFNNFLEYYGIKDKNWDPSSPPCKTKFYQKDTVATCPVRMSIQQCCRIIVKDVVPVNYLKMRTCEGLREKRNLILGYDHIYDDSLESVGGKKVTITDKASYDEAAKLNQKLSLIGCDRTEPDDYSFQHYFKPDIDFISKVGAITKPVSELLDAARVETNKGLKKARETANNAVASGASPAWGGVGAAQQAAEAAVASATKEASLADDQVKAAERELSSAEMNFFSAKASLMANPTNAGSLQSTVATNLANYTAARLKKAAAEGAAQAAAVAVANAKKAQMAAISQAQATMMQTVQTVQSNADTQFKSVVSQLNDTEKDAVNKFKDNTAPNISSQIDQFLDSMGDTAMLIQGGSHMPYMRWWDTGTSAGNPSHGGSFINTLGSYDVVIGVGREERNYEDANDPDVKTRLDADGQLLTQKSQMGRINGWEGLKGHQMWTTRDNNLSCIGRYEKLFKAQGGAENFVLARAGAQFSSRQWDQSGTNSSGVTWPWPLGWRGYVNDPENDFVQNIANTGLDNARKGDIIIIKDRNAPDTSPKQIAYVDEVSKENGFVKIESWDQGKFPTAAGVSIASGNLVTRTIYKTSVPKDYKNVVASTTDAARVGDQPSCEDPNYTSCVLPANGWYAVEIYRPVDWENNKVAESGRLCPYDTGGDSLQTSKSDTNIWMKCVNDGYDPPLRLRRIAGYSGIGTGAIQKTNKCSAEWGGCSSTAGSSTCYPNGGDTNDGDCTKK